MWKHLSYAYDDEGIETVTSKSQKKLEESMLNYDNKSDMFYRNRIREFLIDGLYGLPKIFESLNSEEPWIAYWFMGSMMTLKLDSMSGFNLFTNGVIYYLDKRKTADGLFASARQHISHVILNYVSVNALALVGTEKAYNVINRKSIYNFLLSLKQPNGAFCAHVGGEVDVRITYCAISTCALLNMLTPEITDGVVEYVKSCQNYDGSFSPFKGAESHGAYGYCSMAILSILNEIDKIDVDSAIRWCASRQMTFEGGFNGRASKLVDTCYIWWVGAMSRMLADHKGIKPFWNPEALLQYEVILCQPKCGGLTDKPGVNADMFHTMYGLMGISVTCKDLLRSQYKIDLEEADPRHSITKVSAEKIKAYFRERPFTNS